jgi:hypothetical protein
MLDIRFQYGPFSCLRSEVQPGTAFFTSQGMRCVYVKIRQLHALPLSFVVYWKAEHNYVAYCFAEIGLGRHWYAHRGTNPALPLGTQNYCWRSTWPQWTLWWLALRKSCRLLFRSSSQVHSLCWTQSLLTRNLFTGKPPS